MAPEVSEAVFVKIVELAGSLTKDIKHPSPAMHENDEPTLEYRINLFGKTVKALYQAVDQADER